MEYIIQHGPYVKSTSSMGSIGNRYRRPIPPHPRIRRIDIRPIVKVITVGVDLDIVVDDCAVVDNVVIRMTACIVVVGVCHVPVYDVDVDVDVDVCLDDVVVVVGA
mgnify:CR=1 FL=1